VMRERPLAAEMRSAAERNMAYTHIIYIYIYTHTTDSRDPGAGVMRSADVTFKSYNI